MSERLLIADSQAEAYAQELAQRDARLQVVTATSLDGIAAFGANDNFPLVLAQPDFGARLLAAGLRPRWIQSSWAGVRPLAEAARGLDLAITGLKGVFGPLISEYVFAWLLSDVRDAQQLRAQQHKRYWQPLWPRDLRDCTLVVVGTGSIGRHVAHTGRHFRMKTLGVSRSGAAAAGFDACVPVDLLHEQLADADYVVSTLPDTPATERLFDAAAFAAMPERSVFINVGRGTTVDEAALLEAVAGGGVRGAVLDVFTREPLPEDSPLWSAGGITITPHIAAVSHPRDVITCFVANLKRWRDGAPLVGRIDPVRGY